MSCWHRAVYLSCMSLAVLSTRVRIGMCEVEIVKRLLASDGFEPWTRAALECVVVGAPLDVSDALSNLAAADVICLSEGRVALARHCAGRTPSSGTANHCASTSLAAMSRNQRHQGRNT